MKTRMFPAGVIIVLLLSAACGCNKKDTAVQGVTSVKNQKLPVHEKVPQVKFSSSAPTNLPNVLAVPGGVGKVEWINDVTPSENNKANKKNRLSIIGWVANDKDGTTPPTIIIQLSSTSGTNSYYAAASRVQQKRPDIAKAMNSPAFENSAFQLDADISSVPQGKYMVSFLLSDGKYIIGFDSGRSLEIE